MFTFSPIFYNNNLDLYFLFTDLNSDIFFDHFTD